MARLFVEEILTSPVTNDFILNSTTSDDAGPGGGGESKSGGADVVVDEQPAISSTKTALATTKVTTIFMFDASRNQFKESLHQLLGISSKDIVAGLQCTWKGHLQPTWPI